MNVSKIFKQLRKDIANYGISRHEIETVSEKNGVKLSRQTMINLMQNENGSILNVALLIGTVEHIVKTRISGKTKSKLRR
jgi:hypothetical protein